MKVALLILSFATTGFAAEKTKFGGPITLKESVSLETAIEQINAGKPQLIEAKVDKVCQKKGCFMELKSTKGDDVRVTFKDYGFFVPFHLAGKTVLVEGLMSKTTLTLEKTKHYVQDTGGDPSTVKEPKTEYQIVASAVAIKN